MHALFSRQSMLGLCAAFLFSISLACGGGSNGNTANNGAPAPGGANPGPGGTGSTTAGTSTGSGTTTGTGTTTGSGTGTGGGTTAGTTTAGGGTGTGTGGSTSGGGSGSGTGGGTGGNGSSNGIGYLYVANTGSEANPPGSISGFAIDSATGALTPVPGSPFAGDSSPNVIGSDPHGRFVFVGEAEQPIGVRGSNCNGHFSVLLSERIDAASGKLTLADHKTLAANCVSSIAVDPTGTFVYAGMMSLSGGFTDGVIQGFTVSSSGVLTEVPGSPFQVHGVPAALAVHPNGKFVYGASNAGLQVFSRDMITGALLQTGNFNNPFVSLAISPAGNFMLTGDSTNSRIMAWNIDPNTGAATVIANDTTLPASLPLSIAADPLGSFFAATENSGSPPMNGGISIITFSLQNGGQMAKTPGSPFTTRPDAVGVAFDPAGKFIFSVHGLDNSISAFVLDRTSGKLTPASGASTVSSQFPTSLTTVKAP